VRTAPPGLQCVHMGKHGDPSGTGHKGRVAKLLDLGWGGCRGVLKFERYDRVWNTWYNSINFQSCSSLPGDPLPHA
jgi:hypothetical protein